MTKTVVTWSVALALVGPWFPQAGHACTAFLLGATPDVVFAKSYDWHTEPGLVFANPRQVRKRALTLDPREVPLEWTARYGSLTFNQYGQEFPNGGINEFGLVVEVMWLDASRYPERDGRPSINELQWVQHALDRYASVAELVLEAESVRVAPVHGRIHYLACDPSGDCATLEYLEGQLVVHRGASLPVRALANHPYAESIRYFEELRTRRATATAEGRSSLARFARAASAASEAVASGVGATIDQAFAVLDDVSQGDGTKWQIAYDLARRSVAFRTASSSAVKTVRLADLDLTCGKPSLWLDLGSAQAGDAHARFQRDDGSANRALLTKTLAKLRGLGRAAASLLAAYPSSTVCQLPPLR